ncbi:hypothetical protein D5R40_29300 [Okeania hirsuta]|uniref:Chaperone DnaJ C-terminal domain-containing protein n=1 Tax=Okeania hirsuta TaxID=1458930 RepID=A0A3N6P0C9_9CYAN|nr:hypothetical protein D5R40_29300 [Okeania hirsuta]
METCSDHILEVKIKPHGKFSRRENDLYIDLKVDLFDTCPDRKIKIPSLKGNVSFRSRRNPKRRKTQVVRFRKCHLWY